MIWYPSDASCRLFLPEYVCFYREVAVGETVVNLQESLIVLGILSKNK